MNKGQIIRQTIYLCLSAGYDVDRVIVLLHVPVEEVKRIANNIRN